MEFWNDGTKDLLKEYNSDTPNKTEILIKLMRKNPILAKYLESKADSSCKNHQVYLLTFKNKSLQGLCKIGYTYHNDIRKRFSETRWGEKLEVDKILKQVELPSNGAKKFEKFIKETVVPNAELKGTNPGRKEFYKISKLEQIEKVWNNNVDNYKNMWGIKPPN